MNNDEVQALIADEENERMAEMIKRHKPEWNCEHHGPIPDKEVTFNETHEGCGGRCKV